MRVIISEALVSLFQCFVPVCKVGCPCPVASTAAVLI